MEPFWSFIKPLPELVRDDGDTTISLYSFTKMGYLQPVNDPLFTAHTPRQGHTRPNATVYHHDYPARAVGCLQQVQLQLHEHTPI
jgi:hypothetical protein